MITFFYLTFIHKNLIEFVQHVSIKQITYLNKNFYESNFKSI